MEIRGPKGWGGHLHGFTVPIRGGSVLPLWKSFEFLQENGVICALSDGLRRIVTFLIIAFTSFLPYFHALILLGLICAASRYENYIYLFFAARLFD